jgi:hypothetical protein
MPNETFRECDHFRMMSIGDLPISRIVDRLSSVKAASGSGSNRRMIPVGGVQIALM